MNSPRNGAARQGEDQAGSSEVLTKGGDKAENELLSVYHGPRVSSSTEILLYADGLCEPRNPGGWGCWGWVAVDGASQELATGHGCAGHGAGMTNNVAEYHAALAALRWAAGAGLRGVTLRMDSQLVVNQASGLWGCKSARLWDLLAETRALVAATQARLEWVPREQNQRADALSRLAYREARGGAR